MYTVIHNNTPRITSEKIAELLGINHTDFLQKLDDLVRLPHSTLEENLEQPEHGGIVYLNQNAFIYVMNHTEMDFMKMINFPSADIHAEFNKIDEALPLINLHHDDIVRAYVARESIKIMKPEPSFIEHDSDVQTKQERLAQLAQAINNNIILAEHNGNLADHHNHLRLVYYAKAGEIIGQAKKDLNHGEFIAWVESNTKVSRQQANSYQRLAENYPELLSENVNSDLQMLNMNQALALLVAPETQREDLKQAVLLELENGKKVSKEDIKQMQKNAEANQVQLDKIATELESTTKQLGEAEQQNEALIAQIAEKEKELDLLANEGGLNDLVAKKTATIQAELLEMQVQQDTQANEISTLRASIDEKVQRKLDIERMKYTNEFNDLEQKNRLAKSELETINTQLSQKKDVVAINEKLKKLSLRIIENVTSCTIDIFTTDTKAQTLDYATIAMLEKAAEKLQELATFMQETATAMQQSTETPVIEQFYTYYIVDTKNNNNITDVFDGPDRKKTEAAFKKAHKAKPSPVQFIGYRDFASFSINDTFTVSAQTQKYSMNKWQTVPMPI